MLENPLKINFHNNKNFKSQKGIDKYSYGI